MNSYSGFAQAGGALGLESILIRPSRGIYSPQLSGGGVLDDIVAQVTLEEKHHDELEVTDHPVEQGASIVDHAFKRPAEVTLYLGWSNSPSRSGNLTGLVGSALPVVNSVASQLTNAYGLASEAQSLINGSDSQLQEIYQSLLQLQETRALFTLYTGKRVYTNMVCKSLTTETNNKSENSLLITVECRQVILVNTQTVVLPKDKVSNPKLNASPVNLGRKSATLIGTK